MNRISFPPSRDALTIQCAGDPNWIITIRPDGISVAVSFGPLEIPMAADPAIDGIRVFKWKRDESHCLVALRDEEMSRWFASDDPIPVTSANWIEQIQIQEPNDRSFIDNGN